LKTRASFLLAWCAIAVASCERPRQRARKLLEKVGAGALRHEAALLYKDLFAAERPGLITIKRNDWPASFRALQPLTVGAYRDGFAIAIERGSEGESGIYVIPSQMDVEPRGTQRTRFERLAEGIYWYSFDL